MYENNEMFFNIELKTDGKKLNAIYNKTLTFSECLQIRQTVINAIITKQNGIYEKIKKNIRRRCRYKA